MIDREKMLERVRALLAKADDRSVTPEEADSFRAKADELTTLFYTVAQHCRCAVVYVKYERTADRGFTVPVIGMPADLDYLDMLFLHLQLTLELQVDPRPSERLSLEENLAMMREAGLDWGDITRRMCDAGFVEDPEEGQRWYRVLEDWKHYTPEREKLKNRLLKRYRVWCKETGRPQQYRNIKTYRREFAAGFADKIWDRLRAMKRAQEGAYDRDHESGSMAVALRDIRQVVQDAVYDEFPDLKPHERDCQCVRCTAKRKPVRYRPDNRRVDFAARSAGEAAGQRADISNPSGKRMRSTPEIGGE